MQGGPTVIRVCRGWGRGVSGIILVFLYFYNVNLKKLDFFFGGGGECTCIEVFSFIEKKNQTHYLNGYII